MSDLDGRETVLLLLAPLQVQDKHRRHHVLSEILRRSTCHSWNCAVVNTAMTGRRHQGSEVLHDLATTSTTSPSQALQESQGALQHRQEQQAGQDQSQDLHTCIPSCSAGCQLLPDQLVSDLSTRRALTPPVAIPTPASSSPRLRLPLPHHCLDPSDPT